MKKKKMLKKILKDISKKYCKEGMGHLPDDYELGTSNGLTIAYGIVEKYIKKINK